MDEIHFTPGWHAAQAPERAATIVGRADPADDTVVTFGELDDRSTRLAHALRSYGVEPGGHIAILMENQPAFLEAAWAAQRSGLRYTAINSHLRPAEVQYVLDDCDATVLLTSEAMAEVVAGLDLKRLRGRVATGGLEGCDRYDEVLAAQPSTPFPDEREGREMLYSSGTTGRPKGVRKALPGTAFGDPSSVPVAIAQRMQAAGNGPGSVHLCPGPLYHAMPLVTSMTMQRLGATVVLMERFDPALCLELVERYGVGDAQMVPTMFVRLLRLPDEVRERFDTSSLRRVTHAGAPCAVPVKRRMIEWLGPILTEYYAGTEDIGSAIITSPEWLAHPGSVGRPIDACHILDEHGSELPAGEPGIVYFDGARPFEYHNDPGKTASIRSPQGWRTLGDVGYLDADGYLYLTDRQAHMIISGGVNIYPREAEDVLVEHPAVADVAVIGVPDEEMGEQVKAVVVPADPVLAGADLEAELVAFCRERLATYKCPRSVDFVDELPRDENGKLYKRLVRERYWEGRTSRIV